MLSGRSRANSKSKSRSSSANGRLSADDFEFGDILGEGSYSTVRLMPLRLLPRPDLLANMRHLTGHAWHTPRNKTRICDQSTR